MDVTQALRDAENALRDLIYAELVQCFGDNWAKQSGVTDDRIEKWHDRKKSERKRQEAGVVEERLIYYADFYDLKVILKKHWVHFSEVFGDFKTFDVLLGELENCVIPMHIVVNYCLTKKTSRLVFPAR